MQGPFDHLAKSRTVVVTTNKRDGSSVATPVNVVVLGDHAYFRTWSTSGKAKRLRRDPHLLIAPSTFRGRPTGAAVAATARLLPAAEEASVRAALARKHRVIHGLVVPVVHRLRRYHTVHYELTAAD